jgi:hypothetical protein
MAGKTKSPNYPSIGLSDGIENIRKLYAAHGKTAITAEEAVSAWGHNSLHGLAQVQLSALKKYGLLESSGHNNLRLSQLAIELVLGESDSDSYTQALQEAALYPSIFREVYEDHQEDGIPSDKALKLYLVKNKSFSANGADNFIKAFRDTLSVAKLPLSGYIKIDSGLSKPEQPIQDSPKGFSQMFTNIGNKPIAPPVSPGGEPIGSIPVTRDCVITIVASGKVTTAGLENLKRYIDLIKPAFSDETNKE